MSQMSLMNLPVAVPLPAWVTGSLELLYAVQSTCKEKSHAQTGKSIMEM